MMTVRLNLSLVATCWIVGAWIAGPAPGAAVETLVQVRVVARDAKLIGDVVGGARVTIREVATGRVLAEGVTTGSTGDTGRIMRVPRERGASVFDTPGAAGWLAAFDLDRPTLVEIAAEGPLDYPQALSRASRTILLEPGTEILEDGVVLELHGLIVEILELAGNVDDTVAPVRARVRMLCSCPTEPDGLWSVERVTARLLEDGEVIAETPLSFSGETSIYSGQVSAPELGEYTLEVLAADAGTANFGHVRREISFGPSGSERAVTMSGRAGNLNETATAWRKDLSYLVRELESRHPNLYHTISRAEFLTRVREIHESIPALDEAGFVAALGRLTATIGDGHTGVYVPWGNNDSTYSRLPLEMWELEGGLMVAAARDCSLVGAEVLKIAGVSAQTVLRELDALVPRDNDFTKRHVRELAVIPEILAALGILQNPHEARLEIEDADGRQRVIVLHPVEAGAELRLCWSAEGAAPQPWIAGRGKRYWFATLPESDAVYVQYNDASWQQEDDPLLDFTRRLVRKVEQQEPSKVILDLRWNDGGSDRWTNILLHGVVRIEDLLDQPRGPVREPGGRLMVLIGPGTFSAATQFALDLEEHTNGLFVGLPTGGRPNHYGDVGRFRLPALGLEVRHSRLRFQNCWAWDRRDALTPDLAVPLTLDDYRQGRDPALEAALRYTRESDLDQKLSAALERGDLDRARREIREWERDPQNAYRRAESIVNRHGYGLLAEGKKAEAVALFRLNVEVFPDSANAYDSLGEGLVALGEERAAQAAFEKAIALDPDGPVGANSRRKLDTLEEE